ncbi:hypothetical protein Y032_0029g1906 [Ancylostoma ceylanicum]|uniref:Uncharacterized protein n=1 Tax=Ancylostoma ceylanicum TaxID=53326 RepID=A0A016USD3_9BILA|nr:hypothetical protein Y032_0029g1906 [Ancylostoma ceylanicum]
MFYSIHILLGWVPPHRYVVISRKFPPVGCKTHIVQRTSITVATPAAATSARRGRSTLNIHGAHSRHVDVALAGVAIVIDVPCMCSSGFLAFCHVICGGGVFPLASIQLSLFCLNSSENQSRSCFGTLLKEHWNNFGTLLELHTMAGISRTRFLATWFKLG